MEKPSAKFIIVMNVVMNLPMAIAMSVTAGLMSYLSGQAPMFWPPLFINIAIGFVMACLVNMIFPIQKIVNGFPALFKMKPNTFGSALVGNIPVCALFVVIIGIVMSLFNVIVLGGGTFGDAMMSFVVTFCPLYLVCFIVSMIFTPIAMKAAAAADKK